MSKPAIVLVHGFWGGAAHWAKVIPLLREQGFDNIHAVENPLTSLADDAERTRKMVKQIDGPVVLVGHSYGGKVITEMGDLPNVGALVFIAGMIAGTTVFAYLYEPLTGFYFAAKGADAELYHIFDIVTEAKKAGQG